ncbi:Ribosomal RNA small subunit methyltransferase G [Desulfamplus magnetovallimortis]|uniref:Ribosomal RNA small subunit methyltransferase G n=1 Tax=Desulfamplus magnetovallimortis TaxID=1246637 RepID=A0A1W1H5K3_9BACT|nr:16S rRNA (guanine(527)-N(7))-methyltransferase RsmG [Desulfamplus magnetovallimortis]SLM27724.1 Ribosomal RNA small subunit methyltransferase G [Desulfamplus magnetovallimortis]
MKLYDKSQFGTQWKKTVSNGCNSFGVELSSLQLELLACHAAELMKWNKKINITAIVDPHEIAVKHFIDSIALCKYIPWNLKLLDLGSGGGFPGLPIKIVNPSTSLTMVDASRKKVSFLKHMIRLLISKSKNATDMPALSDMTALQARGEELSGDKNCAGCFDVVVSRAFTSLVAFTEMALPFINDRGAILAMKGALSSEELALFDEHEFLNDGRKIKRDIIYYSLPFESYKRCIVKITILP